jgi:hypothetical protein
MYDYISLSASHINYACGIAQSINNNIGKKETNFFDWCLCSMKSINEVLAKKEILFEDNYEEENDGIFCPVRFKNFDNLVSFHDFTFFDYNDDNKIANVISKYERRRDRFIDKIKESKKIYFLRYCVSQEDLESDEILHFMNNVKRINSSLIFYIVIITNDDNIKINQNIEKHVILIKVNKTDDEFVNIVKSYDYVFETLSKIIL